MFSFKIRSRNSFQIMARGIREQLQGRKHLSAAQYDQLMVERKVNYGRMGWKPRFRPEEVRSDSFFLQEVKPKGERIYSKFSNVEEKTGNHSQPYLIHSLSAAGHGNMRLATIERHMLGPSLEQNTNTNFDKFYKKTIQERRLAVRSIDFR